MTKMLALPRTPVNTSEGMGVERVLKRKSEQAGLHYIQCSDEAPVGRLRNSQVNLN